MLYLPIRIGMAPCAGKDSAKDSPRMLSSVDMHHRSMIEPLNMSQTLAQSAEVAQLVLARLISVAAKNPCQGNPCLHQGGTFERDIQTPALSERNGINKQVHLLTFPLYNACQCS